MLRVLFTILCSGDATTLRINRRANEQESKAEEEALLKDNNRKQKKQEENEKQQQKIKSPKNIVVFWGNKYYSMFNLAQHNLVYKMHSNLMKCC